MAYRHKNATAAASEPSSTNTLPSDIATLAGFDTVATAGARTGTAPSEHFMTT